MNLKHQQNDRFLGGVAQQALAAKPTIGERLGHAIDRVVSIFSPERGGRRMMARYGHRMLRAYREKFSVYRGGTNAYKGASNTRLNSGWKITDGSADQDLLPALPTLRARSRDLNRDDPHAAGVTSTIVSNVIGSGINPQSRPDFKALGIDAETADEFAQTAERVWHEWVKWADAQERETFAGLQNLAERKVLEDGDCFIIPIMIENEPWRPLEIALELVEADRCMTPTSLRQRGDIRDGVEIGERGQPVAYWIRKSHPGDLAIGDRQSLSNDVDNFQRIPARNRFGQRNIYHLYHVKRPGQTRGEPFFAPVISLFKDLAEYLEAEIVGARVAACFSVFIRKNNPTLGFENRTTTSTDSEGKTERLESIEPGLIDYLQPGEDITTVNPGRPSGNFDSFVERVIRALAAGVGLPYELVAKDFSNTSFSSARAAIIEARRMFKQRQAFHEQRWLQDVWERVIEESYLKGAFMDVAVSDFVSNRTLWTRATWIPQGWEWIDPLKDAQASATAINAGLTSLADETAKQGKDWQEVMEQRSREVALAEELGVPLSGVNGVSTNPIDGRSGSTVQNSAGRPQGRALKKLQTVGNPEGDA
jgi:lambda family phage portal protein